MLLAVVFLSPLTITPLYILKPFLLALRTSEVFDFTIVQILTVVGVGIEGILISHHLEWKILVYAIYLLAIAANCERPSPLYLAMPIQDVLG